MIIGIDVGGTHADGVLLDKERPVVKHKVAVDHDNLGDTIITLLEALLPTERQRLRRIHLSTTLCTNALISGRLDAVGMFIQAGPGLNPEFLRCGEHVHFLSGAIDHRGQILRAPQESEVTAAAGRFRQDGVASVGIVTKFSHRNNEHELWVESLLRESFSHISMGHRLSGMPNFPRRVYTTWLNSALKSQFHSFRDAMEKGFARLGITCPCYILKADGGTIPFAAGCEFPCQAIHSGPSASVMGALALVEDIGDAVLLDIGGTSTDIAMFAEGVPLLEPYGATVEGRPTLIRALLTKSIGLGGDSVVIRRHEAFVIGPGRDGQPMAFGGRTPTPTDAMVVLGGIEAGSPQGARAAMERLCPGRAPEETAADLLNSFAARVHEAVQAMIEEVFLRPVYTVSAFLDRQKITPERLILIGGPARALQDVLRQRFALPCEVPEDYEVANAIGAGRARLTVQASLYGDTTLQRLSIPELSAMETIGRGYTMEQAELRLTEAVAFLARDLGAAALPDIDFIERLQMNTVKGFATTGKIYALKAQIRPGLAVMEET